MVNHWRPHPKLKTNLEIKQWIVENKIKPNLKPNGDCLEWTYAGKDKGGYGKIGFTNMEGRLVSCRTHRLIKEIELGRELRPDELVLHKCDNPRCNNQTHLFVGTNKDNKSDSVRKGRHKYFMKKGEKNYKAKLKEKDVVAIRKRALSRAFRISVLAREYKVSPSVISNVISGKTWGWL